VSNLEDFTVLIGVIVDGHKRVIDRFGCLRSWSGYIVIREVIKNLTALVSSVARHGTGHVVDI
jgi:hypothetical protein